VAIKGKKKRGGELDLQGQLPVNPMRVKKDTQTIIVTLQDQTRIKGKVHLPSSGRLSDLMNHQASDRPFLAITDAVLRMPDGTRHTAQFLTVNRMTVTTCFPAPPQSSTTPSPDRRRTDRRAGPSLDT
jgi:hypothetical protein